MSTQRVKIGSERSFGLVFAGVFVFVGLFPLLHERPLRGSALSVGAVFLILAFACPALLAPLNRLWFRFGLALGAVMTPVIMGLLFVLAVIPTALALKLFRKDPMQRRFVPEAATYWERREKQPGPMREQF
jgi:hypothetical protein